jgi:hypothetical protein
MATRHRGVSVEEDYKHTREERAEALQTLYRLREQWNGQKDPPRGALAAIETLIADYERERD